MDGFEINKIFGALAGALGVYVALGVGMDALYAPAHHGDDHALAFSIPLDDAPTDVVVAEPEPVEPLPVLLANASVSAGERLFNQCRACHQVGAGAANGVGPHLIDIVDRPKGAIDGFGYSDALGAVGGAWTWASLDAFIENPGAYAPGTRMNFRGISDASARADLIVWLNAQSDAPVALPDIVAGDEAAAEAETTTE